MDLTTVARFHIAPGADPSDPDSWVWVNRSQDVNHVDGGITIRGGRADETSQVGPSRGTLQLDNAGGHYCTDNPLGRWFGLLEQGAPARWGTISGADAFGTPSASGWGTPDVGISWTHTVTTDAEWSISGGTGQKVMPVANTAHSARLDGARARNGDATFTIMSPVVATGAALTFGMQARYTSGSDHLYFTVDLAPGGVLFAQIRRQYGGSLTTLASATLGWTYSASQRIRMRCQWDGHRLRLRVWPEASPEPTTWDLLASDTTCTGSNITLRCWRVNGNTNVSPVFHFDDLEIEAVEIVGTVERWPVDWDDTATISWTSIEITGISYQLGLGQEPLQSPIRRQLLASGPWNYWPLEDKDGSPAGSSAVTRAQAARLGAGVTFGALDCPAGALSAATLPTVGTRITGTVALTRLQTSTSDGYAGMAYFRMPTLPGSEQTLMEISAVGRVTRWVVRAAAVGWWIYGYDGGGVAVVTSGVHLYTIDPTRWFALQLECEETGGGANTNWTLIWHQVGSDVSYTASGTYAGRAPWLNSVAAVAPVDGTLVSHMWAGPDELPFVDTTFMLVSAGYSSEPASDRIPRLALESGMEIGVEPGTSEACGIQKPGTANAGIRAAETADMGILYESGAYQQYRPHGARLNQDVWMTWAIASDGDVAGRPQPVDDDQRLRNRWTVTREDGGEATDEDADNIRRRRLRPDTATVNIHDPARLREHASWRVHLSTWPEYRWPSIEIDLSDSPEQLSLWRGRPYAPRVTVTGVPSQGPTVRDPSLIVEGWTQEITSHSWKVTASCSPARPWDVAEWDSTAARWDLRSSTTSGSHAAGVTTITLAITEDEAWSSTSAYDLLISGELIGVPIGGMGARTGTPGAYQQILTGAVRAKNGISKTLPAGSEVHVIQGRWSP
ncbi:hypothetical protein Ait01nite_089360 [Actinoplanes italicus]|uniref:Uncharacterized protein n=1 Tax=Actinoplanes italicus TaxID=113567 RepID=A0A2T0JIS8_9ACTN|nr:hypothetical protein [Actinoplanes italicus]PRX07352.1 hypothetical protein CLV67_14227 [Actinoplanes italicus]GIE35891.1 hypothetical protein Ait01nite_089360 [Actinoplanes italicus]